MQTFRKHYEQAIKILDMLNELMSDISWSEDEEELDNNELSLLYDLYYLIEDVEATISDGIYDSVMEITYKEYFDCNN